MLVKLLKLPLHLAEGSPAKLDENFNLFTNLGEYVARCTTPPFNVRGKH